MIDEKLPFLVPGKEKGKYSNTRDEIGIRTDVPNDIAKDGNGGMALHIEGGARDPVTPDFVSVIE